LIVARLVNCPSLCGSMLS